MVRAANVRRANIVAAVLICTAVFGASGCKKQNAGVTGSENVQPVTVAKYPETQNIYAYLSAIKNKDLKGAIEATGVYQKEKAACADAGSDGPNYKRQMAIDDCLKDITVEKDGEMANAKEAAKQMIESNIISRSCKFEEIEVEAPDDGFFRIHYIKVSYPNKGDSYHNAKELVIRIPYAVAATSICPSVDNGNPSRTADILSKYN